MCICFTACQKGVPSEVYGADMTLMGNFDSQSDICGLDTYIDIVKTEAISLICAKENISEKKASKKLYSGGYKIYTYYDLSVSESLTKAYESKKEGLSLALAVTDHSGNLLAAVGKSGEDNLALALNSPYSSLKPLSVYAQGIENGILSWSSLYTDSPYKKLEENGEKRDWPSNASGSYSYEKVAVCKALQKSLNTVAVKALRDVGVNNSIDFLSSNFGINLNTEKQVVALSGEEEVLGNIALGYLSNGVSVIDMAGYYQIFANGGVYEKPLAVAKIVDSNGTTVYERQYSEKRVISKETADIMNRLLREVTKNGATGFGAALDTVQTAGKTGTGDNNSDSWFVGITPQYSCAVWHGENDSNIAPEIFRLAMNEIYELKPDSHKSFTNYTELTAAVYCKDSGKVVSSSCTDIEVGYFAKNNVPEKCGGH